MNGIQLDLLSSELHKISNEFANNPVRSIENVSQKLVFGSNYINAHFNSFDFLNYFHELPLKLLANFSFDEICKLRFSTDKTMNRTIEEAFETEPHFEVVRKITNSWWRWGVGKGSWNELVDVHCGIHSFTLELPPEFDLRLDFTTGNNPCGRSKFSRTFIDGVFAFLIYYHKKHVMTVSFSVMENRRLLIQ